MPHVVVGLNIKKLQIYWDGTQTPTKLLISQSTGFKSKKIDSNLNKRLFTQKGTTEHPSPLQCHNYWMPEMVALTKIMTIPFRILAVYPRFS